ncbi:polyhydroxyalkanoate depolymerase [Ferrovibrio sp.]|uniref:polyhydroxyalkanoate depolymerase n=1 Tax=Ferrovibrio sp. TaxID=1917215 RepID=UPI0025C078AA|nr:polyhydroxyalkanoate depolymerase [Ferrovibrio sp.]MBX3453786.1 polyhydroxyalkanoate depolymerase [Ferrovibrio sp.]
MMYRAYQAYSDMMEPVRAMARFAQQTIRSPLNGFGESLPLRTLAAGFEMLSRADLTHQRPSYNLSSITVGNREVEVTEEKRLVTPFGTLLRFRKDIDTQQPRVLVVAPLSGHYATLLRGTVATLLPEHDVHITDWHNARDVPLEAGRFGFDEYVEHVIRFLDELGPGAHVVAVCQPCVQVLAAAAVMAEQKHRATPASMTLMAGPIDCRINPTEVNLLATGHPIEWFEKNLIDVVPDCHPGAGRRVYPGFVQLTAFMAMNPDRHMRSHLDLFEHLSRGEYDKAEITKEFYDEYFAVLDLAAEFYIETVQYVFQEYRLAKGELTWRGNKVNPGAIRRTALLTVEGEKDDICSVGQTLAAHDLCTGLRPYRKRHHLQPGAGHYGVFNGRRWQNQIYPLVRNLILSNEA